MSWFDKLNDIKIWVRLVAGILVSIVVAGTAFLRWSADEQRSMAIAQATDFATSIHQMTLAGLTGMMYTGTMAQRAIFLDQIKASNHVETLTVFRSDAVTHQFGAGFSAENPSDPHEIQVLQTGVPHFQVHREGKREYLRAIMPAVALPDYLGKNCLNCHAVTQGTVLGAVSMEISLDRANASVDDFIHSATLMALAACLPLAIAVWYFTSRLLTRPLRQMTAGLRRIAEGNIDAPIELPRRGADEIGQATQAFNKVMAKAYELIKAQRLARLVFENSLEGITITDEKSRIQMVNRAFTLATGYSEEEVIGQTPALLKSGKQGEDFYRSFWITLQEKGEWRGEIWNRRKDGSVYPEWLNVSAVKNHRGEVEHYIAIFSDITERKEREEMIAYQAFHDALTGLPNRILFRDRLDQALSLAKRYKNRTPAVMFLDLDRFKQINDTLGHDVGDALLKEVAERLKNCVRDSDTVGRMGGDEFTVLLPEVSSLEDAKAVGDKILASMRDPLFLAGQELYITTSIGVAIYPVDGNDPETIMKHADAAMYQVKGRGRADMCFYAPELDGQPSRRLELENQIPQAIENNEMEVWYQPIIEVTTNNVVGVEAFVCWKHPELGLLTSEDFISIAEESGSIVPLGEWVMKTAFAQSMKWRSAGAEVPVTINLSSRQFHRSDIVRSLGDAVRTTCIPTRLVNLDIKEATAMLDVSQALVTMEKLASIGIHLSLDDFGTGYSNLSQLRKMPLSKLKIDRSLVKDCTTSEDSRAVIEGVLRVAHSVMRGIRCVAEGVETLDQKKALIELGCEEAQGYLFSRPRPAEDIQHLLFSDKMHID